MNIFLNGEPHVVENPGIPALLQDLNADPARVAVVLNGDIVPRAGRDRVELNPRDRVEIMTLAGGG